MDSVDTEVLRTAVSWLAAGRKPILATVVKTWGSAPRPIGAMLVIRDDGLVAGSVSGGCIEDDLIDRVRRREFASGKPEVATYGVTKEQAERFGLPCGGTLQIVLEPLSGRSGLAELFAAVERHELIARTLDLDTGKSALAPARWSDVLEFDGERLRTVHGPRWRLLIIGAGQLSRYLGQMAQALDYQVTVCDPREEYAEGWDLPGVELNRGMPDDVVLAMNMDAHTAVVAVTHDPKLDDMALLEALKSPAFYVGAIGSRANNDKRRRRLAQFDLSAEEIARLRGPVGLPIGSRTPPEIAVSILAEMTAVRRGVTLENVMAKAGAAASAAADPLACK
ncbi:MAG: XdhC family protein [Betaproteobacteria bacterium]|nr:XdhC family protein [Betaproteobacteria bacterium]